MKNNTTALLVMDMQTGILLRLPEQQRTEIINRISNAIKIAREKQLQVIFVRLNFRKGLPEVSAENKMFYGLKSQLNNVSLETFAKIPAELGMIDDDIIVDKKRVSAFSGNDLEMILRAQKISHLVLTGIATSGIVLSTLREAFDKDYQLTVLSDGCADHDDEVHQFVIQKLFSKQSEVMTIDEWKTKAA